MILKKFSFFLFVLFLLNFSSCSGFKPIYKGNNNDISKLKSFVIVTNKNSISKNIKKELIKLLPIRKRSAYILKIHADSYSIGSVSDASRRIARYKVQTDADIKIYYRKKEFDKLVYSFSESMVAPYSLVSDNIRSTLASRNNAEDITVKLISKKIYNRVLVYLSESNKNDYKRLGIQ